MSAFLLEGHLPQSDRHACYLSDDSLILSGFGLGYSHSPWKDIFYKAVSLPVICPM
ncbi:hypothetical protein TorRG33x02_308270, partial [Trema orientale]